MTHISSFRLPCNDQVNCCLFEKLPGEIRDRIFAFALSSYDDPHRLYNGNTPYWRPDCLAPPKVDYALLQTCQRIYTEAWFCPWASTTHKFWLTARTRRPDEWKPCNPFTFEPLLRRVYDSHGQININEIQVFPQLYQLEECTGLTQILSMPHFYPLSFTITIRHQDWWWWENDERLHINARWVNQCRFPDTIKTINIQLESLQRKKDQVDWIAEMMCMTWHFQSLSGTIYTSAKDDSKVTYWTGSSTWENARWVRDEARAGKVDYYVRTVTWKPDNELSTIKAPAQALTIPDHFKAIQDSTPFLRTSLLKQARVPAGADANEAKRLVALHLRSVRRLSFSDDDSEDEDDSDNDLFTYER